jgi:hypothetical protein
MASVKDYLPDKRRVEFASKRALDWSGELIKWLFVLALIGLLVRINVWGWGALF